MDAVTDKKKTGERLRQLRESLGYTQEHFSEILGVSVTLYKKMEGGSYNISVKTLRKLRETTGASVDFIMFGEGKEYEDIWLLLQNTENKTKLKVLLRLLRYFGYDSRECRVEPGEEQDYAAFLDTLMEEERWGEIMGTNETGINRRG